MNETFVSIDKYEDDIPNMFVETPYRESFRSAVWRHFHKHLTDDQRALKDAFDESHGFFDYMCETGLFEVYEAAYNYVAERILKNWLEENSITINVA